ncbi:MAG: hypothetical protein JSW51_03660 [Gemmatimonadota bacterium]|nr:MAG: hypothetical protein JSW51_03660 [Gemmatimonadota bacterium]
MSDEPKPTMQQRTVELRLGWEQAGKMARQRGEDVLIDRPVRRRFDNEEWNW